MAEEMIGKYKVHTAASLFPLMEGYEFDDLVADIKKNGLNEEIWLYKDQLLDGRNRYRACIEAGIEPRFLEYTGPDPDAFVISQNVLRRHLEIGQRAHLAMRALPRFEAEARARMVAGAKGTEKLPDPGEAREKVARLYHVNPKYVSTAKRIDARDPELSARLGAGRIGIVDADRELRDRGRQEQLEENRRLVAAAIPMGVALAGEVFETLVVDPPWPLDDDDLFGRGSPVYATMSMEEILAQPVGSLAAPNSHCYVWHTNRHIDMGKIALQQWGFRYVTTLTWTKTGNFGMGAYFRGSTEHVAFGVRGSQPLLRHDVLHHFDAPRGRHSEKPEAFFEIVESCSPKRWCSLFERQQRRSWQRWGAEVPPTAA